jgi:hypothetical protein
MCVKTCQEYRAFHLRAGHLWNEINCGEIGTMNSDRRSLAVRGVDARAHARERANDAAHRAPTERSITAECGRERMRSHEAGEHSHRAAGITAVKRGRRRGKAAETTALDHNQCRFIDLRTGGTFDADAE